MDSTKKSSFVYVSYNVGDRVEGKVGVGDVVYGKHNSGN